MKRIILSALSVLSVVIVSFGQTLWTGPITNFEKPSNGDWNLKENQDSITDKVILTRKDQSSLFNIARETQHGDTSPIGTEWAIGILDSIDHYDFEPFKIAHGSKSRDLPGKSMVAHLIEEDIYIQFKFISWGSSGGGFSYERSTKPESSNIQESSSENNINVYPNPSNSVVNIESEVPLISIEIFNLSGQKVETPTIVSKNSHSVDVSELQKGVYYIVLDSGSSKTVKKFIKP